MKSFTRATKTARQRKLTQNPEHCFRQQLLQNFPFSVTVIRLTLMSDRIFFPSELGCFVSKEICNELPFFYTQLHFPRSVNSRVQCSQLIRINNFFMYIINQMTTFGFPYHDPNTRDIKIWEDRIAQRDSRETAPGPRSNIAGSRSTRHNVRQGQNGVWI